MYYINQKNNFIPLNHQNSFYYGNYINRGNRLVGGGFALPFVLGGITGGLLAPAFYPRPYPVYPYPPYQQYPIYY